MSPRVVIKSLVEKIRKHVEHSKYQERRFWRVTDRGYSVATEKEEKMQLCSWKQKGFQII